MNCIFCKIVAGEAPCHKIWEDDHFLAFLDINPINPGHTLLIPKKHYSDVFEMNEETYKGIFEAAKLLATKIRGVFDAPKMGLAIEGFGVDHVHIHLVPVYNGNELNPERAKEMPEVELVEIRQNLMNIISAS